MKPLLSTLRPRRTPVVQASKSDDALGRGMDLALTIGFFTALGLLLDNWLGTMPVATICLIVLAAVGSFIHMKYAYDAAMERHEAERLAARHRPTESTP